MITKTEGMMTKEGYKLTSISFIAETEDEIINGLRLNEIKYAPLRYIERKGEVELFSRLTGLTEAEKELIECMKRSVEAEFSLSTIVARTRDITLGTARNFISEYRARCIVKHFEQLQDVNA